MEGKGNWGGRKFGGTFVTTSKSFEKKRQKLPLFAGRKKGKTTEANTYLYLDA